jgi:inositol hexakisphosphate/diphosphoinositol-pentakisphosphate kinase
MAGLATPLAMPRSIRLGVCVMQKKQVKLARLLNELRQGGDLEIVLIPQDQILEAPVEHWPEVDVLIAFYSRGFPLDKAEAYVKLRDPFCFNSVRLQSLLLDRRSIYSKLVSIGVPVPRHVVFDHTNPATAGQLSVHEDHLELAGVKISKPFVEKPVSAEDHK